MAVRGVEQVHGALHRWRVARRRVHASRMERLAERLREWAGAEGAVGVDAFVRESEEGELAVRLRSEVTREKLTELARAGRWSSLAGVVTEHADEIRRILHGK